VVEVITRYSMVQPGHRLGIAVSGGADSVCLLHVVRELAPRWNLHLTVLHLNHLLRGAESEADAEFVEQMSGGLALPFRSDAVDVRRLAADTGDNLEQAARNARRAFFLRCRAEESLDRIALGHTRSDQSETVLFRLLRGAGSAGLAGIRPVTPDGFVRPLLGITRAEAREFLRARGVPWREDATNLDPSFARNRIRNELLPALERAWNPSLSEILANTADWAYEEEIYWRENLEAYTGRVLRDDGQAVLFDCGVLDKLLPAVSRRVIREAVRRVKGDLLGVDFAHIEQIRALAQSREGHGRLQVTGIDVFRSFQWIRIAAGGGSSPARNFRLPLTIPGTTPIPGRKHAICLEVIENRGIIIENTVSGYNEIMQDLDWARISGGLDVRNWRPGDQYQPAGRSSEIKIKTLFQEARIPLWERRDWPVIAMRPSGRQADEETIVWARRFGPAAAYAASSETQIVLKVQEVLERSRIPEASGDV
jgi:tRNA(Ile)-lysidine synthase